jgi:cobalt-zinc-cadmium efflux system protein
VIVAGTLIIVFGWYIVDPIVTLMISGYVLWQAFSEIGGSIRMLMLGTPAGLDINKLIDALREVEGVEDLHHVHAWAVVLQQERHRGRVAHRVVHGDELDARTLAPGQQGPVEGAPDAPVAVDPHSYGHCIHTFRQPSRLPPLFASK